MTAIMDGAIFDLNDKPGTAGHAVQREGGSVIPPLVERGAYSRVKGEADRLGVASMSPRGPVTVGSMGTITLMYRAGNMGLGQRGALRLRFHSLSGLQPLQSDAPSTANFVSAEAPGGAQLEVACLPDGAPEPWPNVVLVRVITGSMEPGDQIIVRLGDTRDGGPGLEFPQLADAPLSVALEVDPNGTRRFQSLRMLGPVLIQPGAVHRWDVVIPTKRRVGESFRFCLRAVDLFGNLATQTERRVTLRADRSVAGLPDTVFYRLGSTGEILEGVAALVPGDLTIEVLDEDETLLARSNPMRVVANHGQRHYWGDLSATSELGGGLGGLHRFFSSARDQGFVDVAAHRAIDRLTDENGWDLISTATLAASRPARFAGLQSFEWTGTPAQGGQWSIIYGPDGGPLVHATPPLSDPNETKGPSSDFAVLMDRLGPHDAVMVGNVRARDRRPGQPRPTHTVAEVHTAKGTEDWRLMDALAIGQRVGVIASSQAHDGKAGLRGGLTCFLSEKLTTAEIYQALKSRRTFATTGCRAYVSATLELPETGKRLADGDVQVAATEGTFGDVLISKANQATLKLELLTHAPVERVELFNGTRLIETFRTFVSRQLGRRIRLSFDGNADRTTGSATDWSGEADVGGNLIEKVNLFGDGGIGAWVSHPRPSKTLWRMETKGNRAGIDFWMNTMHDGFLRIKTPIRHLTLPIADIGLTGAHLPCGGVGRRLSLHRLPDRMSARSFKIDCPVSLDPSVEDAFHLRVLQEDGQMIWTSPIYVTAKP